MTLSVAEASRKRVSTLRVRREPGTVSVCLLAIQGHGGARWMDRASPGDYVQSRREVTGCPTALTVAGWRWPPRGALTVSDDLSRVRGFRRSPATQASRSAFAKLNAVAHLCAGHLWELTHGCNFGARLRLDRVNLPGGSASLLATAGNKTPQPPSHLLRKSVPNRWRL